MSNRTIQQELLSVFIRATRNTGYHVCAVDFDTKTATVKRVFGGTTEYCETTLNKRLLQYGKRWEVSN